MKLFKSYQWNSPQLQKKGRIYDWITIICLVLALLFMFVIATDFSFIALLVSLVLGMIFIVLSWRTQNADKKLKVKSKAK